MYNYGELTLARIAGERFATWVKNLYEGNTSNEVSPLKSRKSVGKEHTFTHDKSNHEEVLQNLVDLTTRVISRAKEIGVSGRLAEVKIRYTDLKLILTAGQFQLLWMRLMYLLILQQLYLLIMSKQRRKFV